MITNEVRTSTSLTRLDADGIVHMTILPGIHETLADAQQTFRAGAVLRAGRRMPVLIDLRAGKSQDRDARHYYSSPEVTQGTRAAALLVASRLSMVMARFFITVAKPSIPTRIFTDEAEALAWLKGFVE